MMLGLAASDGPMLGDPTVDLLGDPLPLCKDLPPVPADFQGPFNCDGSQGPVPRYSPAPPAGVPLTCATGYYLSQDGNACYPASGLGNPKPPTPTSGLSSNMLILIAAGVAALVLVTR